MSGKLLALPSNEKTYVNKYSKDEDEHMNSRVEAFLLPVGFLLIFLGDSKSSIVWHVLCILVPSYSFSENCVHKYFEICCYLVVFTASL